MACAVYRYERHEELPFRLAAQHVAIGRLGKIFPALDKLRCVEVMLVTVYLRAFVGLTVWRLGGSQRPCEHSREHSTEATGQQQEGRLRC